MNRTSHAGFTLIELMVAVALGIILMTMAVPSFYSTIQNNRAATRANEFLADLYFARSEAIKQARTATICRSTNGTSCTGSGSAWEAGWIVWVDSDGDGSMAASGELMRVHETLSNATLTGKIGGADVASVQYLGSGFRATSPSGNMLFTLTATGCKGNQTRAITIIGSGRASVATAACA
ncbi:MAG: type IV fimbrial bioproteinis protein FimT [Gammaproteobacteria bacterium]|nr:MAG: type IV fimbrial bioproteinis protein FimT [Gammaproteobacteria bacterium]TND06690.1 MAG: type IV fimbrial bioproteinis protein FimT [Gammaproteobacteria bacterium]